MNLWRIENDRLKLRLHPGQVWAWDSERRMVFVLAGTQSGKTSFGPFWLYREIERCGAGDYLAVTSNFDLFKLKMLPEMRIVFERLLGVGRFWAGERVIELCEGLIPGGRFYAKRADDPMWGRIILRSAQSEGGLEAATAKAAWLDEVGQDQFTLEDWEAVLRRLSLSQGRVLGTTTLYNRGWMKTEVFDRWRDGDPDYDVIQFPSIMNPAFPRAEYERAQRTMAGWKFSMMYQGQYAMPEALIYGEAFDEDRHKVRAFEIPERWRRHVGIDFGPVNTATLWAAMDPQRKKWVVYRESLQGGMTSGQHAAWCMSFPEAQAGKVRGWWGGGPGEKQNRMDWQGAGVPVEAPPVTSVESQIDRVIEMLKTDRLEIQEQCRGLFDEIGSYSRQTDSSGRVLDTIADARHYHRLDALRYLVTGIMEGEGEWAYLI